MAIKAARHPFLLAGSGALNNLYGGNFQEFALSAEFNMPIGFRRELANVRNAQLKLAREIARLEDAELEVSKELSEAFRALQANQSIMQSSFNRWKETRIESDHFEELEIEGVETLDVALDAQRRQSQAEIAFYTAVCEYNKVIAIIHRRKGTTLPHAGIHFTEGAWAGKAYDDAHENARRRSASRPLDYGWSRPNVISRGGDSPSDQNTGNLTAGDEIGLGYSDAQYGQPQYGQPVYEGQMYDGQIYEGQVIDGGYDSGGQPYSGEIYNDPYVSPGEIIESPIMQGTPAPANMPYNGSQTRNAPPQTRKVTKRQTTRQRIARQVAYEEPIVSSAVVLKASTGNRRSSDNATRAQAQTRPTQTQRTSNRSQRTDSVATITRPQRDDNARPMKRLQARTQPLRSASAEVQTVSAEEPQATSGNGNNDVNWRRLGFESQPLRSQDDANRASIQTIVCDSNNHTIHFHKHAVSRTREDTMQRFIILFIFTVLPITLVGCSMCCGPNDFDYPTYGGIHQRADPARGRVGSILSDPFANYGGLSADSNLEPYPEPRANRDTSDFDDDDDLDLEREDEDLDDDLEDLEDDLERELERDLERDLESIDPLRDDDPEFNSGDKDTTTARRRTRWRKRR